MIQKSRNMQTFHIGFNQNDSNREGRTLVRSCVYPAETSPRTKLQLHGRCRGYLSKFIWKQHFGLYVTCKGVRKHMLHKYHPNFDTQVVDPIQSCSKTYNYRVQSFFGQRFSSQVLGMTRLHFRLRIMHHVSSHRCHLLYTGYIVIVGRRVKQIEMRNV